MADRLRLRVRRPAPATQLTAAARILKRTINDQPAPEDWAPTAWSFRNSTGELRHAETWLGNSMARARLVAARRERPGAEPEPLEEGHPASEAMAELAGGIGGQAALLRAGASYMMTPGVGYLCGFDPRDGGRYGWQFRDANELRLTTRVQDDAGRPTWELQVGDRTEDWMELGPGGLAVKVWRPHPQRHWKPDSPVYGALDILEELRLLTASIKATATSRLAGAGLLPLPEEMTFKGDKTWEGLIEEMMTAFVTPIADRASTAAVVPFPMRMPGQWIDKIKPVQFHTLFDEHALELRQELIGRLGTSMDMPVRALTGEQENHWGKAATSDEGVKLHVTPNLELLVDAITKGYLMPALATGGQVQDVDPAEADRFLTEATQGAELFDPRTGEQIIAWYDLSDFVSRPDKSDDAFKAYDRIEIGGAVLRQETGLSDGEQPTTEEFNRRIWLKIIEAPPDPELARKALVELGVVKEGDLPPAAGSVPALPPGEPPEPEQPTPPALPAPVPATEPDDEAPSQRELPAAAGVDVALVAACDALVHRALERAGNRLRQAVTRRMPGRKLDASWDVEPHVFHTLCHADHVVGLDQLLAGAWERVPEIAARLRQPASLLTATLDDFTRHLLADRHHYSWDLLAAYLAAAMSPAERVLEAAGVAS